MHQLACLPRAKVRHYKRMGSRDKGKTIPKYDLTENDWAIGSYRSCVLFFYLC
jgi:hypothetical protein